MYYLSLASEESASTQKQSLCEPLRKTITTTDTTSNPMPAEAGGTYQSLNMTNSKVASAPYETINSISHEP